MRYSLLLFLFILSCKQPEKQLTAQQIIDKSIVESGSNKVSSSIISFNFRDKTYKAYRKDGDYTLERTLKKNDSLIKDVKSNNGFKRFINDFPIAVSDSMGPKYSNSVNSVHYFSVLPFGLNDKAVQKKILPSAIINKEEYYKVEITFSEEGGGEDFEDVFIYWIGKKDFLIDYLAYSYHTNGGGKRFRVLKEQCNRNGIRFVDYYNYKPKSKDIKLINLDKAFEQNQLKKVSEIILENVKVELLD
ncbi:hypothetical protein OD91_0185 [Lutibacter sp. Hel_I_33_5]|uniref:DUF6503 family protein n=1 Tax=Lutibacter sp. Hel_I_33_5 TaxID=1566289 RepID=UPI0011A55B6B|nr:DUF6503 family protein [Lutibacter sp. Hel_I_33_5]TVZ54947.1 hypothetical protein OD91_0185 [Lutibacter sp. Hel_I_33_5]